MGTPEGFRFSTNVFGVTSRADFVAYSQRVEELGYDTLFAADHVGSYTPFPTIVAAAQATSRIRLGTLVLNVPFWNPALLAREIATADMLTDGRLEVGLGSGHMKWEFDAAGIPWEGFAARTERLERTVEEIGRIFAAGGYEQRRAIEEHYGTGPLLPAQKTGFGGYGPPLIVAGTGEGVLRVAARHASIIGIAGAKQAHGKPPGTLRLCSAREADEAVRFARAQAGGRAADVEWNVLVQLVKVTATAGRSRRNWRRTLATTCPPRRSWRRRSCCLGRWTRWPPGSRPTGGGRRRPGRGLVAPWAPSVPRCPEPF